MPSSYPSFDSTYKWYMVFVFLTSFRMMRLAHYINSISIKKDKTKTNNNKKPAPCPMARIAKSCLSQGKWIQNYPKFRIVSWSCNFRSCFRGGGGRGEVHCRFRILKWKRQICPLVKVDINCIHFVQGLHCRHKFQLSAISALPFPPSFSTMPHVHAFLYRFLAKGWSVQEHSLIKWLMDFFSLSWSKRPEIPIRLGGWLFQFPSSRGRWARRHPLTKHAEICRKYFHVWLQGASD